ncbi:hypothetical protein NM208_g9267 [Fusarium decemcellulare]|uniref:Uncharacterized protein n=1 Tax=Fusarium decemcellulare TaxID=57161 RepID=A0ACC1S268_9HYPO|nr:hypothetical protein NM208_g9267 [Fusarium decemcellulare]
MSHIPTTCFSATRLNATTFRIVEDDKWNEVPFIYLKLAPGTLVLIDTGCGGAAKDQSVELKSLRTFIETYPVAENDGEPLNAGGGIEQFTSDESPIWASGYDRSFIEEPGRLPTSSLCRFFGMQTPDYRVSHWAGDGQSVVDCMGQNLGLTLYQTPGHTPDQLAIWDAAERFLFVGDTLYEWAAILLSPPDGSLISYNQSIAKLKVLVDKWNHEPYSHELAPKVKIACGHITCGGDAYDLLCDVDNTISDIAQGRIKSSKEDTQRGEEMELYEDEAGRISFYGPKKTFCAFLEHPEALRRLV